MCTTLYQVYSSLIEVVALGSCASSMMFSHALVGHSSWEKGRLTLASWNHPLCPSGSCLGQYLLPVYDVWVCVWVCQCLDDNCAMGKLVTMQAHVTCTCYTHTVVSILVTLLLEKIAWAWRSGLHRHSLLYSTVITRLGQCMMAISAVQYFHGFMD